MTVHSPALPVGSGEMVPRSRFAWPDVAVLGLALGFVVFLNYRGMAVQTAVLTAVPAFGALVLLVFVPRGIGQMVRLLIEIKTALAQNTPVEVISQTSAMSGAEESGR